MSPRCAGADRGDGRGGPREPGSSHRPLTGSACSIVGRSPYDPPIGYFTKDAAVSGSSTSASAPLDGRRIKDALERLGYKYSVDADGDARASFPDGSYMFYLLGENKNVLQVRGRWHGFLPDEFFAGAVLFSQDWNKDALWPKTFVDAFDDGDLMLVATYPVRYASGVSDDQIEQHIRTAIDAGEMFFEACRERFPEAAAAYQE